MKKLLILLVIGLFFISCAQSQTDELPDTLPKNNATSDESNNLPSNNADNVVKSTENYETNAFFNEIVDKLPELFENLAPKLRRLGYSKIIMKRQPNFGFRVQSNSMEWIVKSLVKRRKYLLDRISLMITLQFTKFFMNAGIEVEFRDFEESEYESNSNNTQIADAVLIVSGNLNVYPLEPLSISGREYLLRLVYDVNACIIDMQKGSKIWIGSTTWRRNLFVASWD